MKTLHWYWLLFVPILALFTYALYFPREGVEAAAADLPSLDAACSAGKPTLVVFTADWCGYCKTFKEKTLSDPAVKARLKDYAVVYVDMEKNRELARSAGVQSIPTTFALSRTCETKGKIVGSERSDVFLKWLDQAER